MWTALTPNKIRPCSARAPTQLKLGACLYVCMLVFQPVYQRNLMQIHDSWCIVCFVHMCIFLAVTALKSIVSPGTKWVRKKNVLRNTNVHCTSQTSSYSTSSLPTLVEMIFHVLRLESVISMMLSTCVVWCMWYMCHAMHDAFSTPCMIYDNKYD